MRCLAARRDTLHISDRYEYRRGYAVYFGEGIAKSYEVLVTIGLGVRII